MKKVPKPNENDANEQSGSIAKRRKPRNTVKVSYHESSSDSQSEKSECSPSYYEDSEWSTDSDFEETKPRKQSKRLASSDDDDDDQTLVRA